MSSLRSGDKLVFTIGTASDGVSVTCPADDNFLDQISDAVRHMDGKAWSTAYAPNAGTALQVRLNSSDLSSGSGTLKIRCLYRIRRASW